MLESAKEYYFVYNGLIESHVLWQADQKKAVALDECFKLRGVSFPKGVPVSVTSDDLAKKLSGMKTTFSQLKQAPQGTKVMKAADSDSRLLDALPTMTQTEMMAAAERLGIELPKGYVTKKTLSDLISSYFDGVTGGNSNES